MAASVDDGGCYYVGHVPYESCARAESLGGNYSWSWISFKGATMGVDRCVDGYCIAERARLALPAPTPQYSYHSMFVAAAESAALWRCKSCGKEVSNRWHHFHSHTAQRSLCPYCPATYSRIDTLRSHLRLKHAALLKH